MNTAVAAERERGWRSSCWGSWTFEMQHQHQFQMDMENMLSESPSRNKEATDETPGQEQVLEESAEGQNKEISIQASATEGSRAGMLNDNINIKEGINQANPNTGEKAMVLVQTEPNLSQENRIRQKHMRPPRYFEPQECNSWPQHVRWSENRNKGQNKKSKKKKKSCFVCGHFGHKGNQCMQVNDCFICNKKGHLAIDCPDKNTGVDLAPQLCFKCGSSGHDMFSCANDYDSDDLKAIQCYVCKKFGHLCCADYRTEKPTASCYKCGQSGHFGLECTQVNSVANDLQSLLVCPNSGEGIEGTAGKINLELEAGGSKCGKRKKSRKRKRIQPTLIDYPSQGRINPQPPIAPLVSPYYGKQGLNIFSPPEAAAARSQLTSTIGNTPSHQQHTNHPAGTQVLNPSNHPPQSPRLVWNFQNGDQNPHLGRVVINVDGDEAEIPGLFYSVPQLPHIPLHPSSDPHVTQNSSGLSNQPSHLNQNNPRPPPIHHVTPIHRPLNHQTGIHLPHQIVHRQPVVLLPHQIVHRQPVALLPHQIVHRRPVALLPHQIVHCRPVALLPHQIIHRQPEALLPHQIIHHQPVALLPHQIIHRQPVAMLPHQNSDSQTGSDVEKTQIPQLLDHQLGLLPHQTIHHQPGALLPHQHSDNQTGSDATRTQSPQLRNDPTRFLPHQIIHHQPVSAHPHQNSDSETGNSGFISEALENLKSKGKQGCLRKIGMLGFQFLVLD